MLEPRFSWKSVNQRSDDNKISCAKKLDVSMILPCERVFLNKIRRTKFVAKFGYRRLKLRLLKIHQSILGRNWSTETINCFGLKLIYHQAHLILHTNVKSMMVSTVCECWCFSFLT